MKWCRPTVGTVSLGQPGSPRAAAGWVCAAGLPFLSQQSQIQPQPCHLPPLLLPAPQGGLINTWGFVAGKRFPCPALSSLVFPASQVFCTQPSHCHQALGSPGWGRSSQVLLAHCGGGKGHELRFGSLPKVGRTKPAEFCFVGSQARVRERGAGLLVQGGEVSGECGLW